MTSRARKFSAAIEITWDERAQLAEERWASVDRDDDDDDLDPPPPSLRVEIEPGDVQHDEDAPVSAERWQNARVRLTRNG